MKRMKFAWHILIGKPIVYGLKFKGELYPVSSRNLIINNCKQVR
jgi:hypothetical protein